MQEKNIFKTDIFDNPLSEEPNYRLRVIYALPWIKILDRHCLIYFFFNTK